jgi:hypothetical protein
MLNDVRKQNAPMSLHHFKIIYFLRRKGLKLVQIITNHTLIAQWIHEKHKQRITYPFSSPLEESMRDPVGPP